MAMQGFMGPWKPSPSPERTPEEQAEWDRKNEEAQQKFLAKRIEEDKKKWRSWGIDPDNDPRSPYYTLGKAADQTQTTPLELLGIKGAISVPAASSYEDAKTSLNEIAAANGDLAAVAQKQNIEICGFLSDLPSIDIDLSAPQLGIPELQDLVKDINGLALPPLEFASDAIVGVIAGASKAVSDLASAIQNAIPNVTCGGKPPALPVPDINNIGSALVPSSISAPVTAVTQIGVAPTITVTSPNTTVEALNDVIDAGVIV